MQRKHGGKTEEARNPGDSLGGIVEIIVKDVLRVWESLLFDKMDADLAKALMGIGAR